MKTPTTSITIPRDVAERARRVARMHGMPLTAYVAELVDADFAANFGEDAEPLISVVVDDAGKATAYTIETIEPFDVPATLAAAFASNVEQIAKHGGATLEVVDSSALVRVDRKGPAVIVQVLADGKSTKASFGVHRALQIASRLREVAEVMNDTADARAARPAA